MTSHAHIQAQIIEADNRHRAVIIRQAKYSLGDLVFVNPKRGKYSRKMGKYKTLIASDGPCNVIDVPAYGLSLIGR